MASSRGLVQTGSGTTNNEPETRAALDLIFSDHFSRNEPGVIQCDCANRASDQRGLLYAPGGPRLPTWKRTGGSPTLYADRDAWARDGHPERRKLAGKFSSDRTIAEYAADIWNVQPCPVPQKSQ